MNIKKITIYDDGLRGLCASYIKEDPRDGRLFINTVDDERKCPVHSELEKEFKNLRLNLLEICEIIKDRKEEDINKFLMIETKITSIEMDHDGFKLTGEKLLFGTKTMKLPLPKVTEEDEYPYFDEVVECINRIIKETKEYLAGTKKVEDRELLERWVSDKHKEKEFGDKLETISPDQLAEMVDKITEKGLNAKIELPDDAVIEPIKTDFAIDEEIDLTKPEKVKKGRKKKVEPDKVLVSDEHGNMSVANQEFNSEEAF